MPAKKPKARPTHASEAQADGPSLFEQALLPLVGKIPASKERQQKDPVRHQSPLVFTVLIGFVGVTLMLCPTFNTGS